MNASVFSKGKKYHLCQSVEYAEGSIVSKIISRNDAGNITLFAFDQGQQLSEHTAPFDALVQVVEGQALIRINTDEHLLSAGDIIVMPAHIPHAVEARGQFKMLLTMLKSGS